jgi:Fibronectin type III-like domain
VGKGQCGKLLDWIVPRHLACRRTCLIAFGRLHRPVWIVTYNITNTGSVAGAEVSQLYLKFPPSAEEPLSVLRGFESTYLVPGETKLVTVNLSRYDLSVWNSVQQGGFQT